MYFPIHVVSYKSICGIPKLWVPILQKLEVAQQARLANKLWNKKKEKKKKSEKREELTWWGPSGKNL